MSKVILMIKLLRTFCLASMIFFSLSSLAQTNEEGVIVLSDTVTGNQEQPKVLYILPWQKAEDDTLLYQPVQTMLSQDVFNHIEKPEHLREINYLKKIAGGTRGDD